MKKIKKYESEIKIERILPFDPPINYESRWIGPFIKTLSLEEIKKLYPELFKK